MSSLYMQHWFGRLAGFFRRGRQASRPHRRRTRLCIEVLEGRCVPSTVTTLDDAGPGSLRQAIHDTPAGGTVDFQPDLTGTITLTSGELAINKNLTIAGPGADVVTVSGNHASRVFDIAVTFTVSISGLTMDDGFTQEDGGAILNLGTLTVTDCTLSGNFADGGAIGGGGVISNGGTVGRGTLTVAGSTISGNTSSFGGGIDNEGGTLTITDSTLSGNSAGAFGGGIFNTVGRATVTGSTLSGNSAAMFGGGIEIDGGATVSVTDSTLSGNSAGDGGGIDIFSGTLTVTDSALSGNSATVVGGGILNQGLASLTVADSALSGNTAGSSGGGSFSTGRFAVRGLVTMDGDNNQLASGTLMLGAGDTLILAGLGTIDGSLSTAGTLALGDATGPGQLTISGGLTNSGTVLIGPGADLSVGGNYTQTAGATQLDSGQLTATGLVDLEGGALGGTGTVNANVLNNAEVDVGQPGSPGLLTIVGDYTQTAGGVLVVQIGGPNAGADFDQLNVTGQATLDGTLIVNLTGGFVPNSGDGFQVLTFGSGTGVFATVNGDGPLFTPSYDPVDVILVAN
jgi:hypothetical protein